MVETPPNPEDGELWLPSDVFLEIVSTNIDSANDRECTISNNSRHRDVFPTTKLVDASTETEISDRLLHAKPNVKTPIGDGISRFDGLNSECGPFNSKCSFPSSPVQGYKHKRNLSEGTGVFFPRNEETGVFLPRNRTRPKECSGRRTEGTGVFLNYELMGQKCKTG